jgi:hypothetical protein
MRPHTVRPALWTDWRRHWVVTAGVRFGAVTPTRRYRLISDKVCDKFYRHEFHEAFDHVFAEEAKSE